MQKPAILTRSSVHLVISHYHFTGTRYVIGAESSAALAQTTISLFTEPTLAEAIEELRVSFTPTGVIAKEASRRLQSNEGFIIDAAVTVNASVPYPAVNVVQQMGDDLQSHADSRGGGMAFRF